MPVKAALPVLESTVTAVPMRIPPFAVTIPANAAAPFDCIVAAVPTLMSLSNVPIPETNVPLKNVATPATCSVLAIDTLVGSNHHLQSVLIHQMLNLHYLLTLLQIPQ